MAKKQKSLFTGRWRITSMPDYDEDFLDEEEEAYIEFEEDDLGSFCFGNVHGSMDCRLGTRDGQQAVEWTWDGNAEMDEAFGRGWAVLKGGELHGMIFFHTNGDDSEFVAKKKPTKKKR